MIRRTLLASSVILLISLILVPQASAQEIGWVDQFGSVRSDVAWSVATAGGSIYVAGETSGHLPGKTSHGSNDGFLVKYDASGAKVWSRQFGTAEYDAGYGLAADATGIYVAGNTYGRFPGETRKGSADLFLRKFTPAGTTAWTVQFGTKRDENVNGVAIGPDGVSVIGETFGTFGDQHRHGRLDAFLMQFDTSGSRLWVRQFGSPDFDAAIGSAADANGIVVSGLTYDSLPGQRSHGDVDAFVLAFAPDGSRRWTHQFGTDGYDDAWGASVFSGIVYVTGATSSTLPGQTNHGGGDAYVRAYDANGSGLWTRQFGTPKGDVANDVEADATGVYVTGDTHGRFGHQSNPKRTDVFLRALDVTGSGMWTSQFGSEGFDYGRSVASDGAGTAYITGDVTLGAMPTQTAIGGGDAFVAQVS